MLLRKIRAGRGAALALGAGVMLSPVAQAQNLGAPPLPFNPQAPQTIPQAVVPAPESPGGVPEGDLFTLGDPLKPFGNRLAADGVYLKGFVESTLFANVSGGTQQGKVVYNEAFWGADFDLSKIASVPGAVVHLSFDSRFGGMPQGVTNWMGSATDYLQGSGPDNQARLNELSWDQHLFDDKIRFVVGRTTLANYFATSDLYCQFQVGTCSNIGPFTWSADSNSPFWPIAVWAGEVAYFPTPEAYLRVGASESDPAQYGKGGFPWNAGWSTENATGVFVPVEAGYAEDSKATRYAGRYDIGFTYDSTNFPDVRFNTAGQSLALFGGTPRNDGSVTTIYLQAQKIVWRPDASKSRGLTLFASAQFATSGHPLVQDYVQVGAVLHGPFPGRPNDIAGVDFQHNVLNHRSTGFVNDAIAVQGLVGNVANSEQTVEANYSVELAPGIQVKPYTAYTFHPDQTLFDVVPNPKVHYAWAVGVQFSLLLNDAFGLPSFFRPN